MRGTPLVVAVALIAVVVGAYLFMRGNFSADSFPPAESQQSAATVPFTKLAEGSRSTVSRRVNYFITSASQLSELWEMVDATSTPPTIDFEKEAVIAVFAGERPTTGYAISVAKVEDSEARLVSIKIVEPDDRCIVGQSRTAPYEIVAVPATGLPLAHDDISATASCSE